MIRENLLTMTGGQPFLDIIDEINSIADAIPESTGNLLDEVSDRKVRDSTIKWIQHSESTKWLFDEIETMVIEMNKQMGWHFAIESMSPLQYTIYRPGQFYGWHPDVDVKRIKKQRKISFSIMLDDPEEYEGGEFVFYNTTCHPDYTDTHKTIKYEKIEKGDAILFPSFVWHKVDPLVRGTRKSLVGWIEGPGWK